MGRKRRRSLGLSVLEKSSSKKPSAPMRRKLKGKSKEKKQPTMLNFFKRKVVEDPPPPRFEPVTQQAVLTSFFKARRPQCDPDSGTPHKELKESVQQCASNGKECL